MPNKIPTLAMLAAVLLGAPALRADTFEFSNYTVEISRTGGMTAVANSNGIGFSNERVDGVSGGSVTTAGTMTATFTAKAGLIFDKFNFGGMSGGITAIEEGGAFARINWQVNGGTFTGPATYGGSNSTGFAREWEITGPNTGTSFLYGGLWFMTRVWDFNNPVYGSGYYDIGASVFSVDLTSSVYVTDRGYWASFIVPTSTNFGLTFLDAPAAGVPDGASTAALMVLSLGVMSLARRPTGSRKSALRP